VSREGATLRARDPRGARIRFDTASRVAKMRAVPDLIHLLAPRFEAAVRAAFGAEHAGADPLLRRSDRADYQANIAMGLGKQLKRPPRDVAAALVERLEVEDLCARVEIAGPGFINVTLKDSLLAAQVAAQSADARLGVASAAAPETVVIDYSAPNVAKEMHVGHLRSTVLGDAIARVLASLGHRVIRQNHIGDWGTPFGMLIEHLVDRGDAEAARDLAVGSLNAFYKEARARFDADEAFAERARRRVVAFQGGDATTLASWRLLVDASRRYFSAIYARLGVELTDADVCGESFYNPSLPEVVTELEQRGLARVDDGAVCVFPPGFTGREGEPLPLLVRKQDGGYGYAATDLAAIRYRTQGLGARRVIYVVGAPQSQHFSMVFATAELAGWLAPPARAEHVAFGSVLGPDKKIFKTRSGDTVRLLELLDEAEQRAAAIVAEKNAELDEATRAAVARAVGIGAVKYGDLSSDRIKDYVFDWGRMLAFEGNTAPYLQYAHARIRSILRKAGAELPGPAAAVSLTQPAERALCLALLSFGGVVHAVADSLQPHRLCTYLYELASAFTTFYESCPVLRAENEEQRATRLLLCELTARVLAAGLELLGIEAPARM
jgi:arginyl-tRNA synthetase